jgi:5'-3' exonuclease
MGIRSLNKYLYDNCSKASIRKISIEDVRNRTIVIDTSIYIYKYLKDCALEENFEKLIQVFIKYQIRPIFVFDGKSPEQKSELRKERSQNKRDAENEYNSRIKDEKLSSVKLKELRNKFIRVTPTDILMLKKMMNQYNIEFIQAEWEADAVCANYVKSGVAWACLSDDMDMLVYGCGRVIREFSTHSLSGQLYILNTILKELKMSFAAFRDIMIISGTDYNTTNSTDVSLYRTLSLYKDYLHRKSYGYEYDSFYTWLLKNTDYISDYNELMKIHKIFC